MNAVRRWIASLTTLASVSVMLIGGWFGLMELVLRHPGYGWRVAVAGAVVLTGAITFAVTEDLVDARPWRFPVMAGALAAVALGWWVVADDLARPGLPAGNHFEGYLLIAGLVLVNYGVLAVVTMVSSERGGRPVR
jgi:hypothetical protein